MYSNIKFIIRHIKLLSDSSNVIESFNDKILNSELINLTDYSTALKNAAYFEYTFLNYCIQFSHEKRMKSVVETLSDNLEVQGLFLIDEINLKLAELSLSNLEVILTLENEFKSKKTLQNISKNIIKLNEELIGYNLNLNDFESILNCYNLLRTILFYSDLSSLSNLEKTFNSAKILFNKKIFIDNVEKNGK